MKTLLGAGRLGCDSTREAKAAERPRVSCRVQVEFCPGGQEAGVLFPEKKGAIFRAPVPVRPPPRPPLVPSVGNLVQCTSRPTLCLQMGVLGCVGT